jgi:hypothetical protein
MIRQTLFKNWHFMRWLRLGLGLFIAFQAIKMQDSVSGLIAAVFLFQAFTNTGCCGAGGCAVPRTKKNTTRTEEPEFTEIK